MKTLLQYCLIMNLFIGTLSMIPLIFPLEMALSETGKQFQEEWNDPSMDEKQYRPIHLPPRRKGGPLIRVLDIDRNAFLSADEIQNASAALEKLDLDGDGNINRYELHQQNESSDKANMGRSNRNRKPRKFNDYNEYDPYQ